jgi:hypothetical protein
MNHPDARPAQAYLEAQVGFLDAVEAFSRGELSAEDVEMAARMEEEAGDRLQAFWDDLEAQDIARRAQELPRGLDEPGKPGTVAAQKFHSQTEAGK